MIAASKTYISKVLGSCLNELLLNDLVSTLKNEGGVKKKDKGGQKKQSFCSKTNAPVDPEETAYDLIQVVDDIFEEFEDESEVAVEEITPEVFEQHGGSDENQAKTAKIEELQKQIFEVNI